MDLIDQPSGTQQSLLVKALKGDGINFAGKPFDISSTLEFASSESDKRFTLNFASPFRFDAAAQQFSIDELSGSLDQTQFSGKAGILLGRDTEFSADLENWFPQAVAPVFVIDSSDDPAYEVVEVSYPAFLPGGLQAKYFRVRVTPVP